MACRSSNCRKKSIRVRTSWARPCSMLSGDNSMREGTEAASPAVPETSGEPFLARDLPIQVTHGQLPRIHLAAMGPSCTPKYRQGRALAGFFPRKQEGRSDLRAQRRELRNAYRAEPIFRRANQRRAGTPPKWVGPAGRA